MILATLFSLSLIHTILRPLISPSSPFSPDIPGGASAASAANHQPHPADAPGDLGCDSGLEEVHARCPVPPPGHLHVRQSGCPGEGSAGGLYS